MKEITQFAGFRVEIWRRPRQRAVNLRVRPDGSLRVTCNKRVGRAEIFKFIDDSAPFIAKRLAELRAQGEKFPRKQFASDELHLYMGQKLPLQIIWSWTPRIRVEAYADRIEMTAPLKSTPTERQKAMHKFLQKRAHEIFSDRVKQLAEQMKLYPSSVTIRGQKTRWGSCSSEGRVNLNWKLLAAPPEVIDYVVIHELAHLQHMNHSPKFWRLVDEHFPEHARAKAWLRAHEPEINRQFLKIDET